MLIFLLASSTVCVSGAETRTVKSAEDSKTKVTLTAMGDTSIKVKWTKQKNYTNYAVYRKTAKGKTYKKIATVKGVSYTDKKVNKHAVYLYKVRPYRYVNGKRKYGKQSYENSAAAGTNITNYALELSPSKDTVEACLDAGTADCSSNKKTAVIYRSEEKNGTYVKIKELGFKLSSQFWNATYGEHFTDRQISGDKTYYYKMKIKKVINGKTCTSGFSAVKAFHTTAIKGSVVVNHYIMDLSLDAADKKLSGDVTMDITNETSTTLKKICIRNFAASILKGTKGKSVIRGIYLNGKEALDFETAKDPSVVYADLGEQGVESGKSVSLSVDYTTDIPKRIDRFGYHQDDQGQTFQLSFCFPMLDRYENGRWNEFPYASEGECTFNRVTDYDVKLHGPSGYLVAASGHEETRDSVTTIKARDMRDMSIVVSNCMDKKTKIVDGIELNYYLIRNEDAETFNKCFMRAAEDAVSLFNDTYGKYPYDQLDVVQAYIYGGMEFPGLVMIETSDFLEELKKPNTVSVYENFSILLVHEIAHEWFYGAVGNDQYSEPWLDEGLSEYSASVLYLRSGVDGIRMAVEEDAKREGGEGSISVAFIGEEEFDKYMQSEVDRLKVKVNLSYGDFDFDDPDHAFDYDDAIYNGGKVFLYELQKAMGDQKFFAAMKEYYHIYCLKEATTEDFVGIIKGHDDSAKVEEVIGKYIIR